MINMKENTIFRQLAFGFGLISASSLGFPVLYLISYIMLKFGHYEVELFPFLKDYFNTDNPQFISLILFGVLSFGFYSLDKKSKRLVVNKCQR